jgi:alpha-ketoglutarate-dependent taurine dioxygenase
MIMPTNLVGCGDQSVASPPGASRLLTSWPTSLECRDTLWASRYSVYDRLDPGLRSDLEQMSAVHDPGAFRNDAVADYRQHRRMMHRVVAHTDTRLAGCGPHAMVCVDGFARESKARRA